MQRVLSQGANRAIDQILLLIPVLLVIDSMHFVFARLLAAHIAPDSGAMYVLGIAAAQFALYAVVTRQLDWQVLRRHLGFFLLIGLLIGASTSLNYTAITFIDAGTAAMLAKLSTLFGVIFGLVWLGERFTPWQAVGAVLALIGAFLVAFQPGDYLRLGALMLVGSTLMYAWHAAIVKRYGGQIDFLNFLVFRMATSALTLFLLAAARQKLVLPAEGSTWLLLIVTATVDVVISRILYYWALRRLDISVHSLILTISPVLTVVWSYFLFNSLPTVQQLLGGLGVLLGVALVTTQQQRR